MLWYPLSVKRAALLWTVSIFCSYFYWWGFHAEAQHSRLDLTIATCAFVFVSVDADHSLNLIYFPIIIFYIYKHIQFNTITCKQKDRATSSKTYLRLSPYADRIADPWGTPLTTGTVTDDFPSVTTCWERLKKKDSIHLCVLPWIP